MERTQHYLDARAKAAEELFKAHKITYHELERLQCDAMLGVDSGDVKYRPGEEPKKTTQHPAE